MKNIYLIKDLAKVSGCSTHTLKFYLRLGILKEIGRSPETNFRYFDDTSFERLKKIRALQKRKLSLKEIREKLEEKDAKPAVKAAALCALTAGVLMGLPAGTACAQVLEPPRDQREYNAVVAQALDRVEQNLGGANEGGMSAESGIPGIAGVPVLEPVAEEPADPDSAGKKEDGIPMETRTFKPEHAVPQDTGGDIEEVLTEDAGPARAAEILIETKVIRIVLNDEHADGIDWEAIVSGYQEMPFSGFSAGTDAKREGRLSVGTVSREDYDILLDALDTVGVIRTVSEGDVRTEHGTTVTVDILPSEREDAGPSAESVRRESVRFRLTPSVGTDETLAVSLRPELAGMPPGYPEETPQEGVTVRPENGAVIVVGSLFDEVMVESAWKFPLLGDLPLLGFVFRGQEEELRKAEVITFLTVKAGERAHHTK